MKPNELIERFDRYGADLSRWPAAERAGAEALLHSGAGEAWADWRAAEALDAFLNTPVAPPSRALIDKVMTIPQRAQPASLIVGWEWLAVWSRPISAMAVACSLLAGMWIGPATLDAGYTQSTVAAAATATKVTETATTASATADDIYVPGLNWSPDEHEGGLL